MLRIATRIGLASQRATLVRPVAIATATRSMSLFYVPAPLVSDATETIEKLKAARTTDVLTSHQNKTSEQYIAEVPIIEVDGDTAICDGGDGPLGHPIEFIQLKQSVANKPETCKYCGLRYQKKQGHSKHAH